MQLLDRFHHVGVNGLHLCLVMELACCDLFTYATMREAYSIREGREIARQIMAGLDYIHDCGIVHAGLSSFYLEESSFADEF